MKSNTRYFVGDFETTVYKNQDKTEVWASALVELYTENVYIFHSINETYDFLTSTKENLIIYYHNLKFDGTFWLSYFLKDLKLEQASIKTGDFPNDIKFVDDKYMRQNTFKYLVSDMGEWYNIKLRNKKRMIEFRDSLKLLPFSVRKLGDSFATKHKKLDMKYDGYRYPGCYISPEEQEYIKNDVLVVKEAVEIMFDEGHYNMTIGSCCLDEFRHGLHYEDYDHYFPNIYDIEIDSNKFKYSTAGEYVRSSYKGGWCYLVKGKEGKLRYNGTTADVNSLYPSMMSSESGNRYPVGKPTFWKGNFIPMVAQEPDKYYFIRIKTRFKIKENMLPTVQIKNNFLYNPREWLETSDIYDEKTNTLHRYYIDEDGNRYLARPTLCFTMIDYILFREHYDVEDFEILDGCWFYTKIGLFDNYMEKYKQIKMTSKGAKRELAKLFLNNLYGKMATGTNSSFKYAYLREDKSLGFIQVQEFEKKPGYIPIGSAITSYARNFTIRAAQANYYGRNKPGFIYADTDSIHCDLPADKLKDIKVHSTDFCCWKLEASWDYALFVRQKTYIEHVTHENLKKIDDPYLSIKCAGMPEICKVLFEYSLLNLSEEEWLKYDKDLYLTFNEDQKKFVLGGNKIEDFKIGLKVPSKLMPKRIEGGTLLVETTYEMR